MAQAAMIETKPAVPLKEAGQGRDLPPDFEKASGWGDLCAPVLAATSKAGAFAAHLRAVAKIEQDRAGINRFLSAVLRLNGFPGRTELRRLPRPDMRTAQTAALTPDEVNRVLAGDVKAAALGLMADLEAALDGMLQARQVGLIEWEGESVCFYHFFTFRTSTAQAAQRESDGGRERDYERTNVLVRKRHDLMDAEAHPLPAPKVGRPRRVEAVLGTLPAVLAPLIRLVAGTQIREQVAEQVLGVERWTEWDPVPVQDFDPGLCLGRYLLVGWDQKETDAEAAQARRQQEQEQQKQNVLVGKAAAVLGAVTWTVLWLAIGCAAAHPAPLLIGCPGVVALVCFWRLWAPKE